LLEGAVSSQDAKKCSACSSPAKWISNGLKWCQGCATGIRRRKTVTVRPPLPTLPESLSLKDLRNYCSERGMTNVAKVKKPELLTFLSSFFLMPWKPAKTMDTSMTVLRRSMNTWLSTILPIFQRATIIRLENQPVMTNPTMKSVQMILFTLLGHRLETEYSWNGTIEFVHAGTKSRNVKPVADISGASIEQQDRAAYLNRKKTAESDVLALLSNNPTWLDYFQSRAKKNDLADAFLMAYRR
jgi:hypothetical protein